MHRRPRSGAALAGWAPALVLLLVTSACGGPAVFLRRPEPPVTWPPRRDDARIELGFAYSGQQDVERHPGFFKSLLEFLLGTEPTQLAAPGGLALADDEILWLADPGLGAVHRLSLVSGEHRICKGSEAEPLTMPVGVAVAPGGRVFVTDSARGRVVEFSSAGAVVGGFGSPDQTGRPTGIAYDPSGRRLLIVDTIGCRVMAYDLDGQLLTAVGARGLERGQFNFPTNLVVAPDGHVAVVDSMNFRVQVLDQQLAFASTFGEVGRGPGNFASPKGIAMDSEGHLYVVDALFDNVQIFDADGRLLLAFGTSGSALGQMSLPSGICIDKMDRVFVTESGNARVQIFQYLRRTR